MSLQTDAITTQDTLLLDPTSYRSGGTPLGLVGSSRVVGFDIDHEELTRGPWGTQLLEVDVLGVNLTIQFVLLAPASRVIHLLSQGEFDNVWEWFQSYRLGDHAPDFALLLRPNDEDKPHLYIPRAAIASVGPITFDTQGKLHEATLITCKARLDPSRGAPYHYGDPTALAPIDGPVSFTPVMAIDDVEHEGEDDLGTVETGEPVVRQYVVRNTGNAPLAVVNPVQLSGEVNCTAVVSAPLAQTVLGPGQSTTFSLEITPTADGAFSVDVALANNAADNPYEFTAAGTAETTPEP